MSSPNPQELLNHLRLARFHRSPSDRGEVATMMRRGHITRVQRGAYLDTEYWTSLDPAAQHRARAHVAHATLDEDPVFSHLTAVALWRLPVLGSWPDRPHIAGPVGGGAHRYSSVVRHSLGKPERVTIDGLGVTALALTVAQVSAAEGFAVGVVAADSALRLVAVRHEIHHYARQISLRHGRARALAVADFADGRADRPGESISRVSMHAAGLPMPEIQITLYGASGARYVVDFYWRHLRLIGEFDGAAKYRDPEFLRGRTPEQAFADEKFREDDLRAANNGMSRWGWKVANSSVLLAQQLRRAGLR